MSNNREGDETKEAQETRDGKKYFDAGPKSEARQGLDKEFSLVHSVCSLLNIMGAIMTLWHGLDTRTEILTIFVIGLARP